MIDLAVIFSSRGRTLFLPRVVSYGQVKALQLGAIGFACLIFLVLTARLYASRPTTPNIYEYTEGRTSAWRDWKNITAPPPADELVYLRYLVDTYGLTKDIPWFARRVQSRPASSWGTSQQQPPSMTDVKAKFLTPGDFVHVRLDDDQNLMRPPVQKKMVKLTTTASPRPDQVDASALLFGVSTSYQRLVYADHALLRDWQRWLTDGNGKSNGAGLVLTLSQAGSYEVEAASEAVRALGIDAVVLKAGSDAGDAGARYAELVRLLQRRARELAGEGMKKTYLALVDDDVFFPSVSKLLQNLDRFDPKKEFYIGLPSERSDWVIEDGMTVTYGGGAVILTPPMVDKLVDMPCLSRKAKSKRAEDYDDGDSGDSWDMLLYHCITRNTDVGLQVLPSFYNPEEADIYGEQGVLNEGYDGGLPALVLHHYRNWHRFEAAKGHLVTSACGEACFLQRFHFKDDWILVNGYTLSHYPDGVEALPLRGKNSKLLTQEPSPNGENNRPGLTGERLRIEKASYGQGEIKVVAWRGVKKTWRLLDASVREGGEVWQAYVNRRSGGDSVGDFDDRMESDIVHSEEEKSDVDSVVVLIWEP